MVSKLISKLAINNFLVYKMVSNLVNIVTNYFGI